MRNSVIYKVSSRKETINCFKGSLMNRKRIAYTVIFVLIVKMILPFVAIALKVAEEETVLNLVKYYGDVDGNGQVDDKKVRVVNG